MQNDYLSGIDGHNQKFKRETLLNYAMNRWGMNKAASVGATSELIRQCAPTDFQSWEEYYFANATQKKKDGLRITRDFLRQLGTELYARLSEKVSCELSSITEEECVDYVYNLVINRTFEGYRTEVETVYGALQSELGCKIEAAPDRWDRLYAVDFYIKIADDKLIGLQIKPISATATPEQYRWMQQNEENNRKFTAKYGGRVFFVFSKKTANGKKQICNPEVIAEIKTELNRLQTL